MSYLTLDADRLAPEQRPSARRFGIALACVTRIMLLLSLSWLASMRHDVFTLADMVGVVAAPVFYAWFKEEWHLWDRVIEQEVKLGGM